MDNAAKAIIMAGGILIATLVVSVAMYIMVYARDFAKASDSQARIVAIQSFNSFYNSFDDEITGVELLNIYRKVNDDIFNGHEITIEGDGVDIDVFIAAIEEPTGFLLVSDPFTYNLEYDSEGYVNKVIIGNV